MAVFEPVPVRERKNFFSRLAIKNIRRAHSYLQPPPNYLVCGFLWGVTWAGTPRWSWSWQHWQLPLCSRLLRR